VHAIVAAALVVAVGIGVASTRQLGAGDAEARVSNHGTKVVPNAQERRLLAFGGFKDEIRLLEPSGGHQFARVEKTDGTKCFAASARPEKTRLGVVRCDPAFPTKRPVLDFSVYGADRGAEELRVISVLGIAADGVSEVKLLSPSGDVLRTVPVQDNVFALDERELEGVSARSVVAVHESGDTVARLGP
jgi:hypothetical protein